MRRIICLAVLFIIIPMLPVYAAYHHGGDTDSDVVLQVYPEIENSKLDSCALCHSGGQYEKKPGVWVSLGSCQWCHYSYGYDASGNIEETLNSYGLDYKREGQDDNALVAIASHDSDQDGFSNAEEIAALRFPGNPDDDPTKVAAPYQIVDRQALEQLPQHNQLMLMNTHKSGDFYAEYGGVTMEDLLQNSKILDTATGITVYAPDGWAQYHPLEEDSDPLMYHVLGEYPEALFFYDQEADSAITEYGWCDYTSPSIGVLEHGDIIDVADGLKMLLAYQRDGEDLTPGQLTDSNKLDGEGPFRVVPPQKIVGPPDQSVKSDYQDVIWPFDDFADHNAGFSTRSATIIRVEPLPANTTDVDILEAGWENVDEGKILIYGAIDPLETILLKLDALQQMIQRMKRSDFTFRFAKKLFLRKISITRRLLEHGHNNIAERFVERLSWRVDGCKDSGEPDRNDWVKECSNQQSLYWTIYEVDVLVKI